MDPWYKVVTLRKEVREGRSFNPDEFAIHLEQVIAGTAPADYLDPAQFFSRTYFTRALSDHCGLVLRRLSGKTDNAAPVLALVTQFGGGKTHTLTTLYHLARNGNRVAQCPGIPQLLRDSGIHAVPEAKVGAFVGNAWDPRNGFETPWIDIARQLAGESGIAALGKAALTSPPGTTALGELFAATNAPVLILLDEVLNFFSRHRAMAEPFLAFIDNLVRAMTAAPNAAAMISLPRSQIEMTEWDQKWQEKITKVVRRVAKDLIVNDEAEVSEVIRRRLFDDIGSERIRANVARGFSEWCFQWRPQLPREWTAVDTATTEAKARDVLQRRFGACYPFHPGTLSVFQRKWQALPQYQQTRGTLAMLAQWISVASQDAFRKARTEPLITLGSAPLDDSNFRSVVLGQLGESRLLAAIDADIAGEHSHAKALDVDTKGPLRDIHRRVGAAILFESSGGQTDKVAHLPELRFDLGDPLLETTSIDSAATALEERGYFIRKTGSDGFRIGYQPTIKKVVSDRRASLDEETEVKPVVRRLISEEFVRNTAVKLELFPEDGSAIPDTPRLTLVVADPSIEWSDEGTVRAQINEWTRMRGNSPRLYPSALVWCVKKPGRGLRDRVELHLAWRRVSRELNDGTLGGQFDRAERAELQANLKAAEESARDEVWADYRYAVLADSNHEAGVKVIDLGAGHSSSGESLSGRVLAALKSEALLNDTVGAGYIERNWPPALQECGAWPIASLRQSFLNGSLTRLIDPDGVLKTKIPEFVGRGDFGYASGRLLDGRYERVWFAEHLSPDEIAFEENVFLLRKEMAAALKADGQVQREETPVPVASLILGGDESSAVEGLRQARPQRSSHELRIIGRIPPEIWNRFGTRILPKLRSGSELSIDLEFLVTVSDDQITRITGDLNQALEELGLRGIVQIESN